MVGLVETVLVFDAVGLLLCVGVGTTVRVEVVLLVCDTEAVSVLEALVELLSVTEAELVLDALVEPLVLEEARWLLLAAALKELLPVLLGIADPLAG